MAVHLPAPDSDEFLEIFKASFEGLIDDEARRTVLQIGEMTSYSAIAASCIPQSCSPVHAQSDLLDYVTLLEQKGLASQDERIAAVLAKCWLSLTTGDRRRVAFVSALGEPDIPLAWLPSDLRVGSPRAWKLLETPRILERVGDQGQLVRVHRLVAEQAISSPDVDVSDEIAALLLRWEADPGQLDELKREGTQAHSFIGGIRYLLRRGTLAGLPGHERARLEETYVDCAGFGPQRDLEARLRELLPSAERLGSAHPVVLGQIIDRVSENAARGSQFLSELRAEAIRRLREYFQTHTIPESYVDEEHGIEVSAAHHLGKLLIKATWATDAEVDQGIALLRRVDAHANSAPSTPTGYNNWLIRGAAARLQLASVRRRPVPDAPQLLLGSLRDLRLRRPVYLRLSLIEKLLSFKEVSLDVLPDQERRALLEDGLKLCEFEANPDRLATFLRFAAGAISRAGDSDLLWRAAHDAAFGVLARVESAPTLLARIAPAIAHPIHKAGEIGVDEAALTAIVKALQLYARSHPPSVYNGTRLSAALRDAGLTLESLEAIDSISQKFSVLPKDAYWIEFERVKSLRWAGRVQDGINRVVELAKRHPRQAASANDEFAKLLWLAGECDKARDVLSANVAVYGSARETRRFAERCQRWAAEIHLEQRNAEGLLQDQWRSSQRRASLTASGLEQVDIEGRAAADLFIRSLGFTAGQKLIPPRQ